jgi:tRNA(fMet)-specific endonuclease VapC
VNHLLDTNACIALINGKPESVRSKFARALKGGSSMRVSSVVIFELWYGVEKSARRESNLKRLAEFFAGPLETLAFEEEDARIAGTLRAQLERRGKPIGAYDLLIAAQAIRTESVLVTANVSEFSRIEGLRWEDWAKERHR